MNATGILWLDDVTEGDGEHVGSKAFRLARLRQAGVPVPDGFVLTRADVAKAALEAACLRLGHTVAVRSSGRAEDLEEASFAGQYRTELNVRGAADVLAAVERCRRSLDVARAYAASMGAPTAEAPVVLVQRYVEPLAAGVVFTRDPRDPRALVVEAHRGGGESVVGGLVQPERYVCDRETGAVRSRPVSPALSDEDLGGLVALARRAEELFGSPQDVEWALGPEGLVLLQSRPVTVESEPTLDPRVRKLTRANVGEVLPDPVTPLTATTVLALLEHGFQTVAERLGLGGAGSAPFLVLHQERLYLNLTGAAALASRLPAVTAADAERLILGGGAAGPAPRVRLADLPRLVATALRAAHHDGHLEDAIRRAEAQVAALSRRAAAASAEGGDVATVLESALSMGREVAVAHIASSGASAVRLALLTRLLERWAPGDPAARIGRLIGGLEGVASAEPALELEDLAALARARPEASGEAMGRFLDRYGHRGLSEGELAARPWREDPGPLHAALAALLRAGAPARLAWRAAADLRQAEEEGALFRVKGLRRALLRRAMASAREGVRRREHTKSIAVGLIDVLRRIAREAGARLFARGMLARPDDVVFLTAEELADALRGARASRAALSRRRRRYERAAAVEAPRLVDLDATASGQAEDGEESGRGLGVSPGVAVGPARVARAGEMPALEPGEVLVVPVLDAALGPLLGAAAAAVAEIGGMLSHGAVVARELGVPCVVDVRGATRRFRTGERLFVDGTRGEVRRVETRSADGAVPPALPAHLEPLPLEQEELWPLEDHALARESVYVNAQDPHQGLALVASAGRRSDGEGNDGAGEALLALGLPDGRVLFGLERERARVEAGALRVGGLEAALSPVALRFRGRLSVHEASAFPAAPLPLLLSPRTADVRLSLRLLPVTPPIELAAALSPEDRARLRPLGARHVEQSGRWVGEIEIDGQRREFAGPGSRDHSWGRRDWDAAESWRLFTVCLGGDVALHALAVHVDAARIEGGFLWRGSRAVRVARVRVAPRTTAEFDLEVTTAEGETLRLLGRVWRRLTVPVQPERRLMAHLLGRPWRLRLDEGFTAYEGEGLAGHGMAERTRRLW